MSVAIDESSNASKRKLHAVVLPYPAKGHSIPLLHFAKRLNSMGVVVTFVNTYSHLSEEHLRTLDGLDSSMRVLPLGKTPEEEDGTVGLPYVEHVNTLVPDTEFLLEKLTTQNEDAPPSCIVSDMFLGWTQASCCKQIQHSQICLVCVSSTSIGNHAPYAGTYEAGEVANRPLQKEELVYDIPGVPPTRLADLPSPIQNPNNCFYPFYARNCEQMHEASGVLINNYYEMEPTYVDALRQTTYRDLNSKEGHRLSILPVGPLLPKAYFSTSTRTVSTDMDDRDPCLRWLDTQPQSSVLYVSFGSVAVLSVSQIQELVLGLEASGQRFLLVLRPPLNPENVPLLPEGFKKRTEERGFLVMGWVPQLWVLSHRAVGGFLTHCGWNSTLESICQGVPMLAWPIQAEQAMNARFLVDDVKVAIELCKVTDDFVTKDQIVKAVICLMTEPEGMRAKNNVRKLQDLALRAVAEGGSVEKNLEDFLDELRLWRKTKM